MNDAGVGRRTLELFAETPQLNRWIYGKLAPHVRGDVLEIGSGIGTLSRLIVADLANDARVVLSDNDPTYLSALSTAFADDRRVSVVPYDLEGLPPPAIAERRFDTILAVNVVEHVANDRALIATLTELLAPEGHLLVYVPACPFAFGALDRALGHYRRYTSGDLQRLLAGAGLATEAHRYVNLLGLIGWLMTGKVLRRERLGRSGVMLFDRLIPLVMMEDRVNLPIGLGLYAVARKSGA
jgi:2-polyprenyl-3-methyl-5-hydroxy-6-metoxy-1,4-benzoquinol methylase